MIRTHGMTGSKFYVVWRNMRQRCLNPNKPGYKNYGGRGITISKEWDSFEQFMQDMLPSYRNNLSIDRIDNNKDYSKENCRWATRKEQNLNKRNITTFKVNGKFYRKCNICSKFKTMEEFNKAPFYLGRKHTCRKCSSVYAREHKRLKQLTH